MPTGSDFPTYVFRAGCITGVGQRAVAAHGFLAYLCQQVASGMTYEVIGYGGLQVRDNLDASDLAEAFAVVVRGPTVPGVFNIGGGSGATVSVLEALDLAGQISGRVPQMNLSNRRATAITNTGSATFGVFRWLIQSGGLLSARPTSWSSSLPASTDDVDNSYRPGGPR